MITVIDYGMGNLGSVVKACRFLGARVKVTADPKTIARSQAVIFPGVGAFGDAMRELRRRRLIDPILKCIHEEKPFLGLCLGLQLLFERSDESPGVKGLGVLRGRVRRFPRNHLKVPHMGWNQIEKVGFNPLLKGVPEGAFMYFVHSFYADPQSPPGGIRPVAAWTRYGRTFPSVIWNHAMVWATQFHPEKSQRWGLKILKNFLNEAQTYGTK